MGKEQRTGSPALIAVVDDEPDILELVTLHLTRAHFKVNAFELAAGLLASLPQHRPDLIILDLMLPDADGLELCRRLRSAPDTAAIPIIMLTARSEETDKVLGLELGADDYITKPFAPRELTARVKAVLRRPAPETPPGERLVVDGVVTIDPGRFEVMVQGQRIHLTTTEFKILHLLAGRRGWVYSRDQILDHLWGHDKAVLDRTIDVHIKNLRAKLGRAGDYIQNIRGIGYKLADETLDLR